MADYSCGTRGFAGGLWCFWNKQSVNIKVVGHTAQLLNVAVLNGDKVPWCLIGDFNQTVRVDDKYTWSNSQPGRYRIMQCIDQAWCTVGWLLKFPNGILHHLPEMHSDHHPLLWKLKIPMQVYQSS